MREAQFRRSNQAMVLLFLVLCFSANAAASSASQNRREAQPPSVDDGRTSSAVFPLYGNIYPDRLYFLSLLIGDPPRPYFLSMDAGSDLTWIQCDAPCVSCSKGPHPLYKPPKDGIVPCAHPTCDSLHTISSPHCESPSDQCDYEVNLAGKISSRGVLISDAISVNLLNGSLLRPRLNFGCGYEQQIRDNNSPSKTDGVLGIGAGKSSLSSQLHEHGLAGNVFGHCLDRNGGGYLFFGDDLIPSSAVSWTPISTNASREKYSPGPAVFFVGRKPLGKNFDVAFDAGSAFTYLAARPYELFLASMMRDVEGRRLNPTAGDGALSLCWRAAAKPFKTLGEARRYFKPLAMAFSQGRRAVLTIPPENYLILTKQGSVCLGVLNGTAAELRDVSVIGGISMQDLTVVYDTENGRMGWARANCQRVPGAAAASPLPALLEQAHVPNLGPFFRSASGTDNEAVAAAEPASAPSPV
ncbi:aspartic proteinase Asp1-like [Wolffia australiana]